MVKITRISLNRARISFETELESKKIDQIMKIWNEGATFSPAYKSGHWDGFIKLYDRFYQFDLGLVQELQNHFSNENVDFTIESEYERLKLQKSKLFFEENDRKYQSDAVRKFFDYNCGIIIVPTRGGKTFIASSAIKNLIFQFENSKILFIVDGVDLFNQTVKEFCNFLGLCQDDIGKINSKEIKFKNITVAMVQTLNSIYFGKNKNKEKIKSLNEHMRKITMLIVDEIQDTSSQKRLNIYNKATNLKFLMGLSATPFRSNNLISALKVKGFFGGVRYDVTKKTLQSQGYLSMDKAILISNKVDKIKNAENYREYLKLSIHENEIRNNILCKIVQICDKNKIKALFLFNSKIHGNILSNLTGKTFISGDTKSEDRESEKNKFLQNKGGVLLASNIYKKGITLPEVELVVISDGGLEQINVQQKFGRVLGSTENKTRAIIMDILDVGSKYFSEHSLQRLELYDEQIGKNRIEIYEDGSWQEIEESIVEWLSENK